uniref:Lipoxygenase domain-containing protein n=1 Tax=Attheya septentrionalis TaxID=420275 RepID=A0A7S2UT20_9STRA|mmetsp:Transcript_8666/g.15708  ORF Transcript_8666/g.15708 Transcript_8666/m.15708 type:complete len:680 (+) Transcript_8666:146-2185(+)
MKRLSHLVLLGSVLHVNALTLLKEILSVSFKGDKGPLFKNVDFSDDEFVVSFRFGDGVSRDSLVLEEPKVWGSDHLLKGLVNSHFTIKPETPHNLVCEIKQRGTPILGGGTIFGNLFPKSRSRILGTAEFTAEDLRTCNAEDTIKTAVRSADGSTLHESFLEIDVLQKHWKDDYVVTSEVDAKLQMEKFFRLTSNSFAGTLKESNNLRAFQLPKPVDAANPSLKMRRPLPELKRFAFPSMDEFDPVPLKVIIQFVVAQKGFKFMDTLTPQANRTSSIYKIRQAVGTSMETPKEGRWVHPTRDAAMKRIYFSSVGMVFTKKMPGFEQGYVADTTFLARYEVRKGRHAYEPFGCKTFFDESGNIINIEDLDGTIYAPGDKYWEWAKLKSRTAAFTGAAFHHLGDIHYCWGNIPATTLRKFLPPSHPVRRAFTPHFYKTHHTCRRAENSLFDPQGLLFRGASFDYESGIKQIFIDKIGGFKFTRYADEIKERQVENCKFHVGANDGMDLYNILGDYVSDFIDEIYPTQSALEADADMKIAHESLVDELSMDKDTEYTLDAVKTMWGEILFRVTGYHNSVGAVAAYALDPSIADIRMQPKETCNLVASEESALGLALISAITQVPCPTLGECWKQVLENPESMAYAKLRAKLNNLENVIDERNSVRDANVDFHPRFCAISISS